MCLNRILNALRRLPPLLRLHTLSDCRAYGRMAALRWIQRHGQLQRQLKAVGPSSLGATYRGGVRLRWQKVSQRVRSVVTAGAAPSSLDAAETRRLAKIVRYNKIATTQSRVSATPSFCWHLPFKGPEFVSLSLIVVDCSPFLSLSVPYHPPILRGKGQCSAAV